VPDPTPALRPFLNVILDVAGKPPLPESYDRWGFKITRPDLRTYATGTVRFRWPWPGSTVTDPGAVADGRPCPSPGTGGFCVARTLRGAVSGGYGHTTILLLAYRAADVLGEDADKLRVSHALVADVVAGQDVYRVSAGADLAGADLAGADLAHANLARAYLAHADLAHANLAHANLARANLAHADLAGADLAGADLTHANLAHVIGYTPAAADA
jgi:pentapeptide repeat protein